MSNNNVSAVLEHARQEYWRICSEEFLLPWDIIEFAADLSTNDGQLLALMGERMQVLEVHKYGEDDSMRRIVAETITGSKVQFHWPQPGIVPVRLWRPLKPMHHTEWYRLKSACMGNWVDY